MSTLHSPFQTLPLKSLLLFVSLSWVALLSSATIVFFKYQVRSLHTRMQALEKKRFALNMEWSQLLLEKGTWSSTARVETLARTQLGLANPKRDQIRVLRP